jgi:long-chain acyl-CoA synthetase
MEFQLTQALHRSMQQRAAQIAYTDGSRNCTWGALGDRSARLAGALARLGVQTGDRVGILALNGGVYLEYMMGVWWAGAALNPVNTRWSAIEIAYSIDDCDTKILLIDEKFASLAEDLRKLSRSLTTIIYVGAGTAPPGLLDYETLIEGSRPRDDARCGGKSLAGVFYTGGTTGYPKGVMLSHQNLISNALAGLLELNYAADEVILAAAPLFHQAGMCIVIRAILRGCRTVLVPSFAPVDVMRVIAAERVSFTLLVPTMIQLMVDHPELPEYDLSSLRRILYGASPIGEGLLVRAFERLPGVAFYQGYGMTETGGPYTVLPPHYHTLAGRQPDRLRSAGQPIWGMDVRIADPEGRAVPPGKIGEVAARGPGVMLGYWNRPQETQAALRDGWLYSGDAGYLDDEGFLFIVDRVKDMIVSGGENVYSSEVENAISRHPDVAACAVIGIPSERWGEAVHAVVVRQAGSDVTAEDLRAYCKTLIAGYKCPGSIEFRDALPVSAAGKTLKHALREPFWKGHDRRVG